MVTKNAEMGEMRIGAMAGVAMAAFEFTEKQMKLKVVTKSRVPSDLGDILLVLEPQD
jgi:hypothetical protein